MKALDMKIKEALENAELDRVNKELFVKETHGEGRSNNFDFLFRFALCAIHVLGAFLAFALFSGLITLGV